MWLSVGVLALNLIGNIILSKIMGAPGIALSTSIAMTLGYMAAYFYLGRYFRLCPSDPESKKINLTLEFLKILSCSLLIGGISLVILPALNYPGAFVPSVLKVSISLLLLAVVYLHLSSLFRTTGYTLIKPYLSQFSPLRKVIP